MPKNKNNSSTKIVDKTVKNSNMGKDPVGKPSIEVKSTRSGVATCSRSKRPRPDFGSEEQPSNKCTKLDKQKLVGVKLKAKAPKNKLLVIWGPKVVL